MKDEPSPPYAHRDFDQLRLDLPEIREYFPVLWTLNLFLMALVCSEMDKAKLSGVSLESLGLEYIPLVPANRAEVAQNHDARKAVSATLSVLK